MKAEFKVPAEEGQHQFTEDDDLPLSVDQNCRLGACSLTYTEFARVHTLLPKKDHPSQPPKSEFAQVEPALHGNKA